MRFVIATAICVGLATTGMTRAVEGVSEEDIANAAKAAAPPSTSRSLSKAIERGEGEPVSEEELRAPYDEDDLALLEAHRQRIENPGPHPRIWKELPEVQGTPLRADNYTPLDFDLRGALGLTLLTNSAPNVGGNSSTVNEPSAIAAGNYALYTANWYASQSTDGGDTWSFLNPYNGPFAPVNGGFCCDMTSAYHEGSDTAFLLQQYIQDGTTGTQRISVDQGADGTFECFYDITPQDAGFATNNWADFPDFAVSDNFLYHSTNVFTTPPFNFSGAFAGRYPISELSTCAANLNADFHTETSFGSFRFTRGATDTMWFADHQTTTTIRIWTWPEANSSPSEVTRTVSSWSNAGRTCGPVGSNWCDFIDSRIMFGYATSQHVAWGWVPAQNAGNGFPFPYTQIARFSNDGNLTPVDEPVIFSEDFAVVYPSAATNNLGHVGGSFLFGGGDTFPSCAVWAVDNPAADFDQIKSEVSISGTTFPSSERSGDYLIARRDSPDGSQWVASCFGYLSASSGASRFVRFRAAGEDIYNDSFESP